MYWIVLWRGVLYIWTAYFILDYLGNWGTNIWS